VAGGLGIAASGSSVRVIASPAPSIQKRVGAALVTALGQPQRLPLRRAERWRSWLASSWPLVAVAFYLLVAGVMLGQLAVGFWVSRRLKRLSKPVGERRVLAMVLEQSTRWGLETPPELAESPAVAVPVTLGVWRPIILFPSAWRAWSEEKIQAVLAHELSHVVRRDALTRALAAIHRSVFWFSPMAWWLERHLAGLAEQASDDAALRTGADRIFYAKVLLGFYQDLQSALGRVRWEGVAMTSAKQARRRVDRILDSSRRLSAGLGKPAWVALALLAVPWIYLLAAVQPVAAHKLQREDGRISPAPALIPTAGRLKAVLQAPAAAPATPAQPPTPASPKSGPAPAQAPKAPTPPPPAAGQWKYPDSDEDVMVFFGKEMSGMGTYRDSDMEHLRELLRASNGDFIWFRRNGKAYIIRDAATVQQAKAIWSPQEALGKQQEELGRQQEALGAQQEELGKQMEQVRVPVPDLTAELQKLQAQLDELHKHGATQEELGEAQDALRELRNELGTGKLGAIGGKEGELGAQQAEIGDLQRRLGEAQAQLNQLHAPSATQEELGELQGALGDLQGKLGELQAKAGQQQGALGAKQGELGERQGKLGAEQGKLGERQGHLAEEISKKMKTLLDNALAKGLAQPE